MLCSQPGTSWLVSCKHSYDHQRLDSCSTIPTTAGRHLSLWAPCCCVQVAALVWDAFASNSTIQRSRDKKGTILSYLSAEGKHGPNCLRDWGLTCRSSARGLAMLESLSLKKAVARPFLPARPVRPMRCT